MAESPTEPFEHAEHAEHAAEAKNSFLTVVSVTIALLAVFAATVGSLETIETAAALSNKNEAVLLQDRATDAWNLYQARSIKRTILDVATTAGSSRVDDFTKQVAAYDSVLPKNQEDARALVRQSADSIHESEHHDHRHHILTIAVTLLHVGIAVATISIITRGRRWPWYGAMALGVAGLITTGFAYV